MKKLILFIAIYVAILPMSLMAFDIKGQIKGLPSGTVLYLYTNATGKIEYKWQLSQFVDSTAIDMEGRFSFHVPDADYGKLWNISIKNMGVKYFFNKNEDITFEGTFVPFGLNGEKETCGDDELLMQDIMPILESKNFTPIEKRMAIEWLKRHSGQDIVPWALAYFYVNQHKLSGREAAEVLRAIPVRQHSNPFFQIANAHHQTYVSEQQKSQSKGFEIKGYVEGLSDGSVELLIFRNEEPIVLQTDSIKGGHFSFIGITERPEFANIVIKGGEPVSLFLENSVIEVHIRTQRTEILSDDGLRDGISAQGYIYGSHSWEIFGTAPDPSNHTEIEKWIAANHTDFAALYLLYCLEDSYDVDMVERCLQQLKPTFNFFQEYRYIEEKIPFRRALDVGKQAPSFTLKDSTGKNVSLSDFKGYYIVLDFWASWCAPCRAKIPELKDLWNRYHNKGLKLISISIDQKELSWRKALDVEQMPWPQLLDNQGNVQYLYDANMIPALFLINPDGKIELINAKIEQIEEKLYGTAP